MVNELNKSSSFNETDELTERLAASNRQLHEMQEEHRQLLQEMEMLRQRATQLARLNELQQQQKQQLHQQKQRLKEREQQQQQQLQQVNLQLAQEQNTTQQHDQSPARPDVVKSSADATAEETVEAAATSAGKKPEDGDDDTDPQSMEYIREKLNEIAALKAQYKRVQSMINTTNLIEEHIAAKSKTETNSGSTTTTTTAATPPPTSIAAETPSTSVQSPLNEETVTSMLNSAIVAANGEAVNAANEELLGAMLNMFNDFNSDLRNQADGLRAERERIRALKEELIQRKKQT